MANICMHRYLDLRKLTESNTSCHFRSFRSNHLSMIDGLTWRKPTMGMCGSCFWFLFKPYPLVPWVYNFWIELRFCLEFSQVAGWVTGALWVSRAIYDALNVQTRQAGRPQEDNTYYTKTLKRLQKETINRYIMWKISIVVCILAILIACLRWHRPPIGLIKDACARPTSCYTVK